MRQIFFPAGLVLLLFTLAAVVLFGRNGEFAIPYLVREGPTSGGQRGVEVTIAGGVFRYDGDRDRPPEVWVSQPEFSLRVAGASPGHPVLVRNALPLSAYEAIEPGIQTVEGTLLAVTAPGAFSFRPRQLEGYRFLVLGEPSDHLDRLEAALHGSHGALFALCLGNLVSQGDPLQYARVAAITARSPVPVYFAVGNHDLEKGGRSYYRRLFGAENYSFTLGDDRFAVLDTAADYPYLGDDRVDWLDQTLTTPAGAVRHHFVAFHTPPVDPQPGGDHRISYPPLRRGLLHVLRAHRIPLAFASHLRDYMEVMDGVTRYVVTGGLGAGPDAMHPPHGVQVDVDGDRVSWQIVPVGDPGEWSAAWPLSHLLRSEDTGQEPGKSGCPHPTSKHSNPD